MNNGRLFLTLIALSICTAITPAQKNTTETPRVFLIDGARLAAVRQKLRSGDKSYDAAVATVERSAKKHLSGGTFSVTTKSVTPPSGDKHDYMSQAPYFWADPTKKDGLPYIRRDGERNPEINKITDHKSLDDMIAAVENLSLAYYVKGDEVYAEKASQVLRAFFVDPRTRMNPNLQFAQGIPGVTTGRGIGLIETIGLTRVVDAIGLLEESKALTVADRKELSDWFAAFLLWMIESKNGRDEAAAKNNHGTYYDLQIASFALFVGKKDLAKRVLELAREKRIAAQIEPDGRQPLELERTKAWSYSVMNLRGLMQLAVLGERVGVDLWNLETKDGRGIRRALDYLFPYSQGERWNYKQIEGFQPQILFPLMRMASERYTDQKFKTMLAKVPVVDPASRDSLLVR